MLKQDVAHVNMAGVAYHHGNLREALIAAGVELAAASGPQAVVLREVSRRAEVSHNAAYRHFADRDELLQAVSARALSYFGELMAKRIAEATSADLPTRGSPADGPALQRFAASGRAYVEFATRNPGLFRTVCVDSLGEVNPDADVAHPYMQLGQCLDELVAVGALPAERRANAEIGAWAAVHGFAMLVLDGPLAGTSEAEREGALGTVLDMVRFGI